ncbi:hypothetical protein ACN38_g10560 [Penicillium nordicum]|uniref:GP-PDE domain-containing protein n=1 Tax=Penicillium nordicum TaxID=229535 RepID=A0A0M9WBI2_9EURO|nr:hypothetical protein ACN38_g10560 [Penicillium nordicum]
MHSPFFTSSLLHFFNSHTPFKMGDSTPIVPGEYSPEIPARVLHSPVAHASPRLPQAVAHRGFKGQYPENTLLSIDGAIRAGAHALELDLHISRDGIVVLSHVGAPPTPRSRSRTMLIDPRTRVSCAVTASRKMSSTATGSI